MSVKFNKFIIKDTYIIDDIDDTYICIYFTNLINDKYIPMTMYINRYDGTLKNTNNNNNGIGINWNNFEIIPIYKKTNINNFNFKQFIYNNRFKIDKNISFNIYIPLNIQST